MYVCVCVCVCVCVRACVGQGATQSGRWTCGMCGASGFTTQFTCFTSTNVQILT
jgi:hypothetical protein